MAVLTSMIILPITDLPLVLTVLISFFGFSMVLVVNPLLFYDTFWFHIYSVYGDSSDEVGLVKM